MSLYLGENLISGQTTLVGESRNIGQIISSTIPLTDAGLHLLDGSLILGNGIYSAFVDYIASIYDATASYFCTEAEWQQSITQYGVCGKFVYDSVNNTVRLPKITGIIEGTTDLTALGDLIEAGLPNPNLDIVYRQDATSSGVYTDIYGTDGYTSGSYSNTNGTDEYMQTSLGKGVYAPFGAVPTNDIYGNSNTVQPQTIKVLYYIVVATSTKTAIQVDIDEIATDLNGKADVDLSNINPSQSAKNEIISWGMPDYSAGISMGLPTTPTSATTTTYTCPSAGLVSIAAYKSSAGNSCYVFVNGVAILTWTGYSAFGAAETIPVSKNDVIRISTDVATTGWTILWQQFYPLKGEV